MPAHQILAPAGSFECLAAALKAGTHAVYFGLDRLNMRSLSSKAFTADDLPEIARRCRAAGVEACMTINSLIYDEELPVMREQIAAAKAAGIDAVIAADAAVLLAAREAGISAHLSTQLNIGNIEALAFYAQFADVVVLARELTLEQIAAIHAEARRRDLRGPSGEPIRIEAFCHGALCMAVSGKCYLSTHTKNSSANRGACLQNCRRTYRLVDAERGIELDVDGQRFLSPKDLKTIELMDKMCAAGISVFKIEGRARSPEYVYETVRCYREALELAASGRWAEEAASRLPDWNERLSRVFNRGFWTGWYMGAQTMARTDAYGSSAAAKKVYAGKVLNYFAKAGVAHVKLEAAGLEPNDSLMVIGPTTGVVTSTLGEFSIEDPQTGAMTPAAALEPAPKGAAVTFKLAEKVRPGDKLYRIVATH